MLYRYSCSTFKSTTEVWDSPIGTSEWRCSKRHVLSCSWMRPSLASAVWPALLLTCLLSAVVFSNPAEAGTASAPISKYTSITQISARKPLSSSLVASQWKFSLPERVLQKTFLQQGSTAAMKKVMLRLLSGQTVHVGALGGSVTVAKQDPDAGGYFGRTVDWMRQAFPKANIIARNGAISGSTAMFVENHLGSQLDPGVDLVFIEYAVNSFLNTNTIFYEDIASYERILRSVLTGAHSPPDKARPAAAVLVNMWRPARYNGTHYTLMGFHEHTGDHFNVLSQYYSVPVISVRNGFHHAYRMGQGIFSNVFREYPPNQVHSMTHPFPLGHKYIADIVIYALYMVLGQIEQYGITRGDRDLMMEALPPPMVANEFRQVIGSWNAEATSDIVIRASGWEPLTEAGKFGFQTSRPGSSLQLKVDTRVPDHVLQQVQQEFAGGVSSPPNLTNLRVIVQLGLLQSYEHMGIVRARCIRGCTCKAAVFDTSKVARRVSITHPYPVAVSSSQECILELTCEKSTSSGEHKLSLRGVSVVASIATGPLYTILKQPK